MRSSRSPTTSAISLLVTNTSPTAICGVSHTLRSPSAAAKPELLTTSVLSDGPTMNLDSNGHVPLVPAFLTALADMSDAMVATDPVTPKDIADEVTEMEELRDRLIDERKFEDPYAEFTGINRGGQTEGLKCQEQGQPHDEYGSPVEVCPMDLYNKHIIDNFYTLTDSDIQQLLCTYYLTQYAHKIGSDEFPAWLNHCVPKVVRNG